MSATTAAARGHFAASRFLAARCARARPTSSAIPIHESARKAGFQRLGVRNHRIAARAIQPQTQSTGATPYGQVNQNGAWREKLPSENRKDEPREAATDAMAKAARAKWGNKRTSERFQLSQHSAGAARRNRGRKITADSFDSSAKANRTADAACKNQRLPGRQASSQSARDAPPKRKIGR